MIFHVEDLGTIDDVAHAAMFLANDQYAGYISGTVLRVDGGLSL
jgi:NAD(P)-dependent dehydrogenase (short-subunit alcohol dehydrogenase family)